MGIPSQGSTEQWEETGEWSKDSSKKLTRVSDWDWEKARFKFPLCREVHWMTLGQLLFQPNLPHRVILKIKQKQYMLLSSAWRIYGIILNRLMKKMIWGLNTWNFWLLSNKIYLKLSSPWMLKLLQWDVFFGIACSLFDKHTRRTYCSAI